MENENDELKKKIEDTTEIFYRMDYKTTTCLK